MNNLILKVGIFILILIAFLFAWNLCVSFILWQWVTPSEWSPPIRAAGLATGLVFSILGAFIDE